MTQRYQRIARNVGLESLGTGAKLMEQRKAADARYEAERPARSPKLATIKARDRAKRVR